MNPPFRNVGDTLESLEISFGLDMKVFPGRGLRPLVKLLWLALDNNDLKDIGETDLYRSVFYPRLYDLKATESTFNERTIT